MRTFVIDFILIWVSAISFILFGCGCFASRGMRREYERYGLSKFRSLVGSLQVFGAIGLMIGIHTPWVGQVSSSCLALLMLCGVGVRIKIKDTALQTIPAFAYMVLNAYLGFAGY